jgi:hypothetical protein
MHAISWSHKFTKILRNAPHCIPIFLSRRVDYAPGDSCGLHLNDQVPGFFPKLSALQMIVRIEQHAAILSIFSCFWMRKIKFPKIFQRLRLSLSQCIHPLFSP